jgi:hypothetical protein
MDSQALRIWRLTLLLVTAAECCLQTGVSYWQASFRPDEISGLYGLIALSLPATALLAAITLYALWRFLGPDASLTAGYVALLGMKLAAETFQRVFSAHHQDFYQGGAMLAGVVIGETYARLVGITPERGRTDALEARRFGMTGALAMLAGSYIAAGSSKVLTGGIGWATSSAVRLMVLSHTEVEGNWWALLIPHWTASSPYLCMALEVGTLIIQLGSFMLIVGPRARRLWATLLVAFHAGIYVTSGILFLTPMLMAAVVAVPWARILGARPDEPSEEEQSRPATRRAALVLVTVGVMLAMRLGSGW